MTPCSLASSKDDSSVCVKTFILEIINMLSGSSWVPRCLMHLWKDSRGFDFSEIYCIRFFLYAYVYFSGDQVHR